MAPALGAPSARQRLVFISASVPALVCHSIVQLVPVLGVWLWRTTPSVSVKLSTKKAISYPYAHTSATSVPPHTAPHRNMRRAYQYLFTSCPPSGSTYT